MKISRRDFLAISLLISTSIILSGNNKSSAAQTPVQEKEIIVVGAGISGLSAARYLQQQGYQVIILEARERIGGRIWTDRSWQNLSLDLGASWIHGIQGNPITKLAQQFQIKTVETDYESRINSGLNGRFMTDAQENVIEARFNNLLKKINKYRKQLEAEDADDIPLQKAFDRAVAELKLSQKDLQELNYAINSVIEHEFAADAANLSLYYWDQGTKFQGKDVLFPNGYDQIIQALAQKLDVRLEHVVQKIEYDDSGVNIITNQGNFACERAVITLPLGVLKSGRVEFSPALDDDKQLAIQRLGMGVLNKVYLRFPQAFWQKDTHLLGNISDNKGEWTEFLNIHRYTGFPVLLGFNAGSYGSQIEQLSDEQIVASAMKALQKMYGAKIPNPEAWLITRWEKDAFAGGAYSYIATGASGNDCDELAKPVGNRLFFAGEATSRKYAATVHGAFLSGEREAKRIVAL